jgi:hypothetical protein
MKKILITIAITLLFVNFLFSQVPQGINYQAVIRDPAGNILQNHNVGIKINIHEASISGSIVYAETFSSIPTSQFGLVNLVIGQGTVMTGIFDSIPWGTNTFYSEILLDTSASGNYISMGTQQMISVPYALFANKANESQTLSINGSNLSISSGNTVTLPNGSGSSTNNFQQLLQEGIGYSFVTATSEPNVDSFLAVFGYYPGNNVNSAIATVVKKDALTGAYEIQGGGASVGQCGGGNGVAIITATTHQGGVYYTYTNGCGTNVVASSTGAVTMSVYPTNSNGQIFSDGTYIYVNDGPNFLKYTVSGNVFTQAFPSLTFTPSHGGPSIMCDGQNYYTLSTTSLYKYDLNGNLLTQKSVFGSPLGMINIDATKLYLLSSSLLPSTTTNDVIGSFIMTPISKP